MPFTEIMDQFSILLDIGKKMLFFSAFLDIEAVSIFYIQ